MEVHCHGVSCTIIINYQKNMSDQPIQNPLQSSENLFEQIRPIIVRELRAEGLTPEQQDTLMKEVGEALLQRVTTALLKKVPPSALFSIGELGGDDTELLEKDQEQVLRLLSQYAPDAEEVIQTEVQAGLQAYHAYLDSQSK